jgi:hypothetical protein
MATSQGTATVPTTSLPPLSDDDKNPQISVAIREVVSLILTDQQQTFANPQNDLVKMVEMHKKLTGKDPLSGSVETRSTTSNTNVSPSFLPLNTKLSTQPASTPVTQKPSTSVPPKKNDKFQKRRLKLQKFFNQNTVLSEQELKTIFSVLDKDNEKETDEIREAAVNGFLSQLNLQPSSVSQ